MSALAEYLLSKNISVSGSDVKKSDVTLELESRGAKIFYGHDLENVKNADLVVYTDAISLDNPELEAAIKQKVDILDRASFLGKLMDEFDISIAISGTHGKTTTTSMLSEVLIEETDKNPTIMVGGNLDKLGGNSKIGDNKLFLTEACEYKANVKKYHPTIAVILNIDEDHLDYFDNINHIIETFEEYASNVKEDGYLILNSDDENSKTLRDYAKSNVVTFGIDSVSDYSAKNIVFNESGFPSFDVYFRHKKLAHLNLKVMGKHNIYNSMAAFCAAHLIGISEEKIANAISDYTGVHRRLEYKGKLSDIEIIDDYAHHPTEIRSTLSAIRNRYDKNIYCIFQPHTYTRTKILLNFFAESFYDVDSVIIPDIYAAREKDYGDIHSKMLVDAINECSNNAKYMGSFEEIENYLLSNIKPGDAIITMGAGDVYKIGEELIDIYNKNPNIIEKMQSEYQKLVLVK